MRIFCLLLLYSLPLSGAAIIPIVSYSMQNGESAYLDSTYDGLGQREAPLSLLSQGLGKLTDGRTGAPNWDADLGYGSAYEWVGWLSVDPVITVQLPGVWQLDRLKVHANDSGLGGVRRFRWATVRLSEDGSVFPAPPAGTISFHNLAPPDEAGYFVIPLANRSARAIEVTLREWGPEPFYNAQGHYQGIAYPWVFVSEIQVTGVQMPEGNSLGYALLGLAMGGLRWQALRQQRRRTSHPECS